MVEESRDKKIKLKAPILHSVRVIVHTSNSINSLNEHISLHEIMEVHIAQCNLLKYTDGMIWWQNVNKKEKILIKNQNLKMGVFLASI